MNQTQMISRRFAENAVKVSIVAAAKKGKQ
jgi:hypothetical protein